MRVVISPIAVLAVLLIIAGCSSPKGADIAAIEGTRPASGMARFVLYYPKYWAGSGGLVQVRFKDRPASCRFNSGNYMVSDVAEGDQSVAISFCGMAATSYLQMKVMEGQTYYFRVRPYDSSVTGELSGYPSEAVLPDGPAHKGPFLIERVEEAKALSEIEPLVQSDGLQKAVP